MLPEFSQEDDVKKLSLEMGLEYYIGGNYDFENGVRKGYNKAKETYKYTEEDLRKAIELAREGRVKPKNFAPIYDFKSSDEEIIQSLQQSKLPKYFECETITMNEGYTDESDYPYQEVEIPKTTITTQDQTELIGTYFYE